MLRDYNPKYDGFPQLLFRYNDRSFCYKLKREYNKLQEPQELSDPQEFSDWFLEKFNGELLDAYVMWPFGHEYTLILIFKSEEDKTMFILKYL